MNKTVNLPSIHEHISAIQPKKLLLIVQRFNRQTKYEDGKEGVESWLRNRESAFQLYVEKSGIAVEVQEEANAWSWLANGGLSPMFGMIVVAGEVLSQSITIVAQLRSRGIKLPISVEITEDEAASVSAVRAAIKNGIRLRALECFDRLAYLTAQKKTPRFITIELPSSTAEATPQTSQRAPKQPTATDNATPPRRLAVTVSRVIRDSKKAQVLKQIYEYQCQVCGFGLPLGSNLTYAEVHHVIPLGKPHNGKDVTGNMLVLCPNHHAMFDFGLPFFLSKKVIVLDGHEIRLRAKHELAEAAITYHNETLHQKNRTISN